MQAQKLLAWGPPLDVHPFMNSCSKAGLWVLLMPNESDEFDTGLGFGAAGGGVTGGRDCDGYVGLLLAQSFQSWAAAMDGTKEKARVVINKKRIAKCREIFL